jgi:hypothetical protein
MSGGGYRVTSACVVAKDQTGRLHHFYHGDWIPWLNEEQRRHWLRLGLVEEIVEEIERSAAVVELRPAPATDAVVNPDIVRECIDALDRCGVPREMGRPTARAALRSAGFRFGNDVVAAAPGADARGGCAQPALTARLVGPQRVEAALDQSQSDLLASFLGVTVDVDRQLVFVAGCSHGVSVHRPAVNTDGAPRRVTWVLWRRSGGRC